MAPTYNLRFELRNGKSYMEYDVYPRSQETPIIVPDGAVSVALYLGVTPLPGFHITTDGEVIRDEPV